MTFLSLIQITKRLFGAITKGTVVAKEDVVAAGIAAIQAGEVQVYTDALGGAYDGGFVDGKASNPVTDVGPSEEQIQARINEAVSAAQAVDAQALADAQALKDAAYADLQKKFDDLSLKEGQESGVIAGLQGSLQAIKDAEASLQSLFPAPVPAPADPIPVEPDPQP